MGEQSPYIELENRVRFLEQERVARSRAIVAPRTRRSAFAALGTGSVRLRREQVLHPEPIEANLRASRRALRIATILSNQMTDATNRLNEIAITTDSLRTIQRQLLGTVREQHGRMAALEEGQTSIRASLVDIQTTLRRIAGDAPPEGTAHA